MVERPNTGLGIAHVELLVDLHELDEHVFIVLGRRCRDVYAGDHVDTAEMKLMTKVSLFSMVAGADLYVFGFPDVGVLAVFQNGFCIVYLHHIGCIQITAYAMAGVSCNITDYLIRLQIITQDFGSSLCAANNGSLHVLVFFQGCYPQ